MAKDSSGELTTRSIAHTIKPISKTKMMFSQLFVKKHLNQCWVKLGIHLPFLSTFFEIEVKLTQKHGYDVALEKPSFLVLYLNE